MAIYKRYTLYLYIPTTYVYLQIYYDYMAIYTNAIDYSYLLRLYGYVAWLFFACVNKHTQLQVVLPYYMQHF